MNSEALFLFLILLLGLVLCSFLGGNCNKEYFTGSFNGNFTVNAEDKSKDNSKDKSKSNDSDTDSDTDNDDDIKPSNNYDNYNHYSRSSSQLTNGTTFYGENGGSIKVNMKSNGSPELLVTLTKGATPVIFLNKEQQKTNTKKESFSNYIDTSKTLEFYGPNGEKALVINYEGQKAIKINTTNGSHIYTINNPVSSNQNSSTPFNSNYSNYNNTPSTYYGSTGVKGANINNSNKAFNDSQPQSQRQSSSYSSTSSYDYSNSLPPGIPRNMIPPGKEDLYILKSEIVPPVCPACPVSTACPRQEPCPPCPACARCPEPSFECKKVPNYSASANNEYLPIPVLNDFSSFGM
jgi:hypothetical protein